MLITWFDFIVPDPHHVIKVNQLGHLIYCDNGSDCGIAIGTTQELYRLKEYGLTSAELIEAYTKLEVIAGDKV